MGAQDNLPLAEDFIASTGITSIDMLWGSSDPWRYYGVSRNSSTIILGADGAIKGQGFGPDLDEIRELIG